MVTRSANTNNPSGNGRSAWAGGERVDTDLVATAGEQVDAARFNLPLILWHRRWIVFAGVILCLLGGLVYLTRQTPRFKSTAQIYVERRGPKVVFESQGVMMESTYYLDTQCELIRSTPVLAAAIEPEGGRGLGGLKTFVGSSNPVGVLKSITNAVADRNGIISVAAASPHADEAAQIANAVVDAYTTFYAEKKRSTAAEVLRILQGEKEKNDNEFARKLQSMLEFRQEHGTFSFDSGEGNVVFQRLDTLSQALTEAQLATIEARTSFESVKAAADDPDRLKLIIEAQQGAELFTGALDRSLAPGGELNRLELQLADLRQTYTPDAPAVSAPTW